MAISLFCLSFGSFEISYLKQLIRDKGGLVLLVAATSVKNFAIPAAFFFWK